MAPEPYRTRVVESIRLPRQDERKAAIEQAFYNPHLLPADKVYIDLLSDSGTGALSAPQLAALVEEDESFAYQRSYSEFVDTVRSIFGFEYVYPVHQGRAGEHILCNILVQQDCFVPSNTHFGTTRANVGYFGGTPVDLVIKEAYRPDAEHPFKGNIDLERTRKLVREQSVPVGFLTITNNSLGSQPCSLENIRGYKELMGEIPLYLDACRFAENAWFIKQRERGFEGSSVREIVKGIFSEADGCMVSGKKDGLSHIGGFLATNDKNVAEKIENLVLLIEGFPTHGGVTGRDLRILSLGLNEVLDEDYLSFRVGQITYLFEKLKEREIPLYSPPGGNAVYIDAGAFLPHLVPDSFPGFALASEVYLAGAVRVATSGLPSERAPQLVRISIPRRVYSNSHLDYVVQIIDEVYQRREEVSGLRLLWTPPYLAHHVARFAPA
jgi:tryptophanase